MTVRVHSAARTSRSLIIRRREMRGGEVRLGRKRRVRKRMIRPHEAHGRIAE
jgi:hypothetical protein